MKYNSNSSFLKVNKMYLFALILLCINISVSLSQNNFLAFRLILSVEDGDLKGAQVSISKNGKPYRIIDSKSKVDLELDLGNEYVFTAKKTDYVTKSIVIDTNVPEGRDQEDFAEFQSEIILKPQPVDQEITYTQPVGRIAYDDKMGDFNYDKDYSAKAREMEKKAEAEPRKKKKEEEKIVSNPEIIKKDTIIKKETNSVVKKEIPPDPPLPPVVRTVVERVVQQDKLKITYRTVTINDVAFEYRKEEFSWGGVYFYKGPKNITEATFEKDTK